eukprot:scaffold512181_cov52-Prasinocladus_malaysianus.AAC.1
MKLLAAFTLALAFLSISATQAVPLTGAGGFAQHYRGWAGLLAEVSSVKLPLPLPEVTVELWVRRSSLRSTWLGSYLVS